MSESALLVLVSAVFVLSAVAKLREYSFFCAALRAYRLGLVRNDAVVRVLAPGVVGMEAAVGFCLLFRLLLPWAVCVAIGLLLLFSAATATSLLRLGGRHRCGCMLFDKNELIGWHACLRNMGLCCLALPSLTHRFSGRCLLCGAILTFAAVVWRRAQEGDPSEVNVAGARPSSAARAVGNVAAAHE
jgi:hypothetical protein